MIETGQLFIFMLFIIIIVSILAFTKQDFGSVIGCMLALIFLMAIFSYVDTNSNSMGWSCKWNARSNSELYCSWQYNSNISDSGGFWVLGNHTADAINAENARIAIENALKQEDIRIKCYNAGKDYKYNFDIMNNYNLSCNKIGYINDHLIDKTRQVDGGYIKGSYSGFFSSGYVEGHLYAYVTEGVLATGMLMKEISYHLDCNNITSNKVEKYYSESDFVMYYVDKCIDNSEVE